MAAANPHTVVVIESGGAQVMPWLANVGAVLEAWYPGQRGGEAIANLLFGDVNPSGKLPITFPASVNDLPHPTIAAPPANSTAPFPVTYDESFLVGYKCYDAKSITPLFPFGYGLSYTTFTLTNAQLTPGFDSNQRFQRCRRREQHGHRRWRRSRSGLFGSSSEHRGTTATPRGMAEGQRAGGANTERDGAGRRHIFRASSFLLE